MTTKLMIDRFLSWPLPESLCSDPCASMPGYPHRTGTNLMTVEQAKAMLDYVLAAPAQGEAERRDWPDDDIVSAWKWCEENGGTPAEFLSHSLLVKLSRVLGRQLTWREAIELTAMTTNMPDDQRDKLLAMDDTPPQPAEDYPACDYCGCIPDHHPWHGSGFINGAESPHIHACNDCRHLLPKSPSAPLPSRGRNASTCTATTVNISPLSGRGRGCSGS